MRSPVTPSIVLGSARIFVGVGASVLAASASLTALPPAIFGVLITIPGCVGY